MNSLSLAIAGRIVRFGRLALNVNRRIFFQTAAALALLLSLTVRAGDWPQFRGPGGNGVAQEDKAPLHWGPTNNVRWKATLPGPGNSSPIVSHGRVFVTCAEDSGKKRNLYCFDRRTGKELWVRTVEFPRVEPTHQSNPYCGSTPAADGARVVVWHGSAGVFCYNFDGKELWKTDLGEVRNEWGYGSSPILHRGKVMLNFGPGDRAFLAALDLKTGKLLWKYDELGGSNGIDKRNIGSWSTPVVSGGIGVAFTGWGNGPTIGFKLGGAGDVTASNRLWLERQPQRIGSGVIVDGLVFIVNAGPGTAQCMECQTGKIRWTERLDGGESWGSVVMAAGRLYVTSRRGFTTVFRPDPEKFELLAMNDLGEPSNATPAISDG